MEDSRKKRNKVPRWLILLIQVRFYLALMSYKFCLFNSKGTEHSVDGVYTCGQFIGLFLAVKFVKRRLICLTNYIINVDTIPTCH